MKEVVTGGNHTLKYTYQWSLEFSFGCQQCLIFNCSLYFTELFPKPVLHYGPKNDVDEGSFLNIECQVNSSLPIRFSLIRNNRLLVNDSVYSTIARLAHRGVYACVAESKGITKKSDPVQIRVHGELKILCLEGHYLQNEAFWLLYCSYLEVINLVSCTG